jgi:hypothetical protein
MRAWTRTLLIALAGTICAIALVACGTSGATAYHNPKYPYGAPNVPISLSKCMRGNGVPDFPDPREGPNGGGVGFPGGLLVESSTKEVARHVLAVDPPGDVRGQSVALI